MPPNAFVNGNIKINFKKVKGNNIVATVYASAFHAISGVIKLVQAEEVLLSDGNKSGILILQKTGDKVNKETDKALYEMLLQKLEITTESEAGKIKALQFTNNDESDMGLITHIAGNLTIADNNNTVYNDAANCAKEQSKKMRGQANELSKKYSGEEYQKKVMELAYSYNQECAKTQIINKPLKIISSSDKNAVFKVEGMLPFRLQWGSGDSVANWVKGKDIDVSFVNPEIFFWQDPKNLLLSKSSIILRDKKTGGSMAVQYPQILRKNLGVSITPKDNLQKEASENKKELKTESDDKQISPAGINLLFANLKLTAQEKAQIYQLLDFRISKDGKKFTEKKDTNDDYAFDATAKTLDLNKDGVPEVVVNWGNTFTSGVAGSSVTLFIKNSSGNYQSNLDFGGDIAEIILPAHNSFPDLSISGPGMKTPIWRFDGYQYKYFNSVTEVEYKKLQHQTLSAFEKSSSKILNSKTEKNAGDISNYKFTPPSSASIHFIYKRWKTIDVIGNTHEAFIRIKEKGEAAEIEFSKDHKLYMYKKGVLGFLLNFIIAPDGKSMLLSESGKSETVSMQILSLSSKQLIIKNFLGQEDTMIFTAR